MITRHRDARDKIGRQYELAIFHHPHCVTCRRRLTDADRKEDAVQGCGLSLEDFCGWCLRPTTDAGRAIEAKRGGVFQKPIDEMESGVRRRTVTHDARETEVFA